MVRMKLLFAKTAFALYSISHSLVGVRRASMNIWGGPQRHIFPYCLTFVPYEDRCSPKTIVVEHMGVCTAEKPVTVEAICNKRGILVVERFSSDNTQIRTILHMLFCHPLLSELPYEIGCIKHGETVYTVDMFEELKRFVEDPLFIQLETSIMLFVVECQMHLIRTDSLTTLHARI